LWRKLTEALRHADIHSLAGDYLPTTPSATGFKYVLTAGRDAVRWSDPIPEKLSSKLTPLLRVLGQVVAASERVMPEACGPTWDSHRTP
jgi:hypothetical protein